MDVVLDDYESVFAETHRMSEIGARLSLVLDLNLSLIPIDAAHWAAGASLFVRNVAREGVTAP